jgi:RHS repeat-associated protein
MQCTTLRRCSSPVGGFEYSNSTLQHFAMSEGRVLAGAGTYQYFLKDHLGNVRMTVTPGAANSDKIVQQDFYYPFGMRQAIKMPGLGNKKLYNGKELVDQNGLNLYHYGARWYDPMIGRWTTMDPANQFYSPYVYVGNGPICMIDPTGKQTVSAGIQVSFTLFGIWNISIEKGIAFDFRGNIVTYTTGATGPGIGPKGDAAFTLGFSTAPIVYDLKDKFAYESVGGGDGAYGGLTYFTGYSDDGIVNGFSMVFGLGGGASYSAGISDTRLNNFFDTPQMSPIKAAPIQAVSTGVAQPSSLGNQNNPSDQETIESADEEDIVFH